ncbi:MAG: PLP-dependent aminotransferase family protein [Desulfobacteraceae bacterium]|nr:PLP-dependent aminotransferase family protein [Desulfobacteraceae bacterium]
MPLYETVASKIVDLVERGTFNPGERVPSIRNLSRQLKVSVNTVKTAYAFLEDRRVIQAKPQSGYYVCPRLPEPPSEPEITTPAFDPAVISASDLVLRIMGDVMSPDIVQFGAAIPDPSLVPTAKLTRMLSSEARRFPDESTAYAMPPGNIRLRTQIAKHMMKAGCTLHPDDIIITNGASEAVFLALRAICKPGDTLVIGAPLYFTFLQMIQSLGLKVLEIPMSPTRGINLEALEIALDRHRVQACLLIPNFNNPLGFCMDDGRKKRLLGLLKRHAVPVIEDDINGDLSFSGTRPSVIKAWDRDGDVLLCSSFSKTLAPGYRVGWIAPGKYMDSIQRQKLMINIATPTPTQLAVAEFLVSGGYEHHLRSIRKIYGKRIVQMADAVGHYFPSETRVTRPEGGFALWVEMPGNVDSIALYGLALKKGITVAPGKIFSTTDRFNHCIRLNAAFWSGETRWAVKTLGKIVCQLSRNS